MNIILHGDGQKRAHLFADVVQNKIIIPVKVVKRENKWSQPVITDVDQTYTFVRQEGDYFHYQLDHVTSKQS